MRKSTSDYPPNWKEIAKAVKDEANWKCIRCNRPHDLKTPGRVLTVHHLTMNPSQNEWWNLAALCAVCHLQIQAKVVMHRQWYLPHSEWFKPYVAGYYASVHGLPTDKQYVMSRIDDLLAIGQGREEAGQLSLV